MSKTVWVIEAGSYSDYRVVGVFTSEKNAQLVADYCNRPGSYGDKATVAEWSLDPIVAELNAGRRQYNVCMLRDGTVERCNENEGGSYDLEGSVSIWQRTKAPAYAGKGVPDAMTATVWAKDSKHAVKIVNEHRAQWIAAGKF